MAKLKTHKTKASVTAFLNAIEDDQRRADSLAVARLMQDVTGEKPAMWGPSIVGFGSRVYTGTRSGGVWPVAAFSPRKQYLAVYLRPGFEENVDLMAKLGPHTTGKSCLYMKRLSDLHQPTLRKLIAASSRDPKKK